MLGTISSIISSIFSTFWYCTPVLFFIYFITEINYYFRVLFAVGYARYFRTKIGFLEPSEVYGIVLPNDADFFFNHLNNSRYFREYDFARFDHAVRTGFLDQIHLHGGGVPVAAHVIRYRLPVMMFSIFKIISRPVWWDSKFLIVEQRIVTPNDGIVRSVGYTKTTVSFNIEDFVAREHPGCVKPEIDEDLKTWMEYLDLSRDMMKKDN